MQHSLVTPFEIIALYSRTEVSPDNGLVTGLTPLASLVASRNERVGELGSKVILPTLSEVAMYGSGRQDIEDGGIETIVASEVTEAKTPEELAIMAKKVWQTILSEHGEVCRVKLDFTEKPPPAISKLVLPMSVYDDEGVGGFAGYFARPDEIEALSKVAEALPLAPQHDVDSLPQQQLYP